MKSSGRVELEIISIGQDYLQRGVLSVEITGRYFPWTDIINLGNLLEASHFVETIEHHQNHKNACLEEIAFKQGWPDLSTIEEVGLRFDKMVMGNTSWDLLKRINPKFRNYPLKAIKNRTIKIPANRSWIKQIVESQDNRLLRYLTFVGNRLVTAFCCQRISLVNISIQWN